VNIPGSNNGFSARTTHPSFAGDPVTAAVLRADGALF